MTRPRLLALLVFLAALAGGGLLVALGDRLGRVERVRGAESVANVLAHAIEQELTAASVATATLATLVAQMGEPQDFDEVARGLLSLAESVDSLQLAPGGVLQRIYPLAGNESAIGLDLMSDPVHRTYVAEAMVNRRVVLAGPFDLRQGGVGLAARAAVYTRVPGGERFWGLASAVVRLPRLLTVVHLERLGASGFEYELAKQGADGQRVVFSRSADRPLREPVAVPVLIPNGRWELAVEPRGGWGLTPSTWLGLGLALAAALAVGALAHRLLQEPERLRQEVAARTAELEAAHEEQRQVEASLRQAQKLEAVGLLAGGVAHDFNNLLVGIVGYADLLSASAEKGTLAEEASQIIGQAARRASELTKQLLAFARKGKQREVPVDLGALMQEVSRLLTRTIGKDVEVVVRPGAPHPTVIGDPGQLQQVVLNLAVNARDAMPAGGRLTLETEERTLDAAAGEPLGLPPGRYLVLAVSDTGTGIPAELRERIFEPFFTTKGDERGTGMGLAMVYGIVKNHGGAVRVESVEGQGSRFEVWLPAEPLGAERPSATPPPLGAPPRGQGRVLVVDDEPLVRHTAERLVRALGYEPVSLEGGQAAVDWLVAHPGQADAVVLDLGMPGMDGQACFQRLRALDPGLPVVISSGFSEEGKVQALLDAGAVDSVPKPYTAAELGRALAAATGQPAAPARPGGGAAPRG